MPAADLVIPQTHPILLLLPPDTSRDERIRLVDMYTPIAATLFRSKG